MPDNYSLSFPEILVSIKNTPCNLVPTVILDNYLKIQCELVSDEAGLITSQKASKPLSHYLNRSHSPFPRSKSPSRISILTPTPKPANLFITYTKQGKISFWPITSINNQEILKMGETVGVQIIENYGDGVVEGDKIYIYDYFSSCNKHLIKMINSIYEYNTFKAT